MKFAAIALLTVLSSTAFACPELKGEYKNCFSTTGILNGAYNMTVAQEVVNGNTVYTVTAINTRTGESAQEVLVADGKTYSETDPEDTLMREYQTVNNCEGDTLVNTTEAIIGSAMLGKEIGVYSKEGSSLKLDITVITPYGERKQQIICE